MSNPRGAPAQIQLAASRNPFQLWMGAAKICLFPKSRPKKRGRAGKRKSPSGVFYTAILKKKKPGTERHPHPRTSLQASCERHKITFFSFTGIIPARNFSKRGPKQADAGTFLPKPINCTSHIQKACESCQKTTWKFRVPAPERNPWMKVFIGPKAKNSGFLHLGIHS